ncbi:hypothetical protein SAMN05428966_10916 [Massilia sp. PDC64]|nr:hypothetical protein [Massilia sp. PDC64]SDE53873.1 hypothetical protein SAMN05428966_10916 [Massilia sp. PDC64]
MTSIDQSAAFDKMEQSRMDLETWKLENEKKKRGQVEWLRKLNLSYDDLLKLTASLILQGQENAREHERLRQELRNAGTYYSLVDAMDNPKFSRAGILHVIKEHAARHGDESPAAKSIAKAVAAVESMQKDKAQEIARRGPEVRKAKMELLKAETIKLFEQRKWKSVPAAAHDITPVIVALSKNGNGDLLPTTTKPLEWIRAHKSRPKK